MASLIGFDKNRENVEFKGYCKLSINFLSNYLYVEPENEEFKLISASFQWIYIMKNNLLFVLAEFDFLDFCLVFKSEQLCKKTFDYIASGNVTKITRECCIDKSFILPIYQRIATNPTLNSDLMKIIADWIQLLDKEEKEKYSNLGEISGVLQNLSENKKTSNLTENRKRKFVEGNEIEATISSNKTLELYPTSDLLPSQYQLMKSYWERHLLIFAANSMGKFHEFTCLSTSKNDIFKCITCEQKAIIDINENDEICVKVESKQHFCNLQTKIPGYYKKIKLLQKPNYQIFGNCVNKCNRYLIIFDSEDKSECREYFWQKQHSIFCCKSCYKNKIDPTTRSKAKIYNEGTDREYVEISSENHQCQKIKFDPSKYRQDYDYLLKPDFEILKYHRNGKESQRLIIFDKNDRTMCYFYTNLYGGFSCRGCIKKGKDVTAKLRKNGDGEEYVILSRAKHICEPKLYITKKRITLKHHQDFEIMEKTHDSNPRIFIFVKDNPKLCYIFNTVHGHYYCVSCTSDFNRIRRKKETHIVPQIVTGHLIQDEKTGEYSFQMSANQRHICQPRPYQPKMFEFFSKSYEYFYFRPKNMKDTVRMAIISPKSEKHCYIFAYEKSQKAVICIECRRLKKTVRMKPQKDDDGKEFFNLKANMHICKPTNISTITMPKFEIVKDYSFEFNFKPKIAIDESKIVRIPNFELHPSTRGIPDRKLIVGHPTDCVMNTFFLSLSKASNVNHA